MCYYNLAKQFGIDIPSEAEWSDLTAELYQKALNKVDPKLLDELKNLGVSTVWKGGYH
jgi:hypothetical protein